MNGSLIAILWFLFNGSPNCTCAVFDLKSQINGADLIAQGQVISVDSIYNVPDKLITDYKWSKPDSGLYFQSTKVFFLKDKLYKGDIKNDTLQILTGIGGGDCGFPFVPGKKYVVYSHIQKHYLIDSFYKYDSSRQFSSHPVTVFYTNVCDRTTDQLELEDKILKEFFKGKK
jgi:hypothetical protein